MQSDVDGQTLLERLRQLGLALADGQLKRQAYRLAMLNLLYRSLACSRVSLWRFDGQAPALRLVCRASISAAGEDELLGQTLAQAHFHRYFAKLAREGVFACADTAREPALAALRPAYLEPQDVRALMDVSFAVNGRLYGVLCCEQQGATRAWTRKELGLLLRFGRMVSLQVARVVPEELCEGAVPLDGFEGTEPGSLPRP